MNVLITGASGTIGGQLISALGADHELRCLSRRPAPAADPRWTQADVTQLPQLERAMEGMDAVIHLAIATGHEGDYEDDDFNRLRMETNVRGTYNVFEAAQRAGVKRVVHTSSLTVVWGYVSPEQVPGDAPARPVGTYALTKYLAEEIARHYATLHGMQVACLRIPKPVDLADEETKAQPILPQWIAFPDLVRAYGLALTADIEGFELVTLTGESRLRRWDLERARQVLGYEPEYDLEMHGYMLREEPGSYAGPNVVWSA